MKICPKCKAEIIDTAKFCNKCGFNVKKYEEEKASEKAFCTECGAQIPCGSAFCPECGLPVGTEGSTGIAAPALTEPFADTSSGFDTGWLSGLEVSSEREELRPFEYESHGDGTYTVTGIKNKQLPKITVPEGVVVIGDGAFSGSGALSIELPDGLLKIGDSAFKGLKCVFRIELPDSVVFIGDEAFMDCPMLEIDIPDSVQSIGRDAIKNTATDKKIKAAEEEKRLAEERRRAEEERIRLKKEEELRKAEQELYNEYAPGTVKIIGRYEQGCGIDNLEGVVLDVDIQGRKALVITKYIIDRVKFNEESKPVCWENSSIRSWLNNEFYNSLPPAFRERIITTNVRNAPNREYGTYSGNDTKDRIFLLSEDEVRKYYKTDADTRCQVTLHAKNKGAYCDAGYFGYWWLRTSGQYPKNASYVVYTGGVSTMGYDVSGIIFGVRPAMWIRI